MLALIVIYSLLAVPLKSYTQPLVVMTSIPFGFIGAVVGHYLMGYDLVFFSLLGMVALSGVVINSSLVLVDFINRNKRTPNMSVFDAVVLAGTERFRPIFLTSVTTFVGLIPLMFNADLDTAPFVPLAVSLGFGVIFATTVTLILIPTLYFTVGRYSYGAWYKDAQGAAAGKPLLNRLSSVHWRGWAVTDQGDIFIFYPHRTRTLRT